MKEIEKQLEKVKELVNTFEYNIDQYKSKSYDEANTRVDFIDKFFECLDWDVRNTENCAEQYRQVVREDKVTIQGKPKAPDYSFRIYGQRKFFVEAKKPSVDIVKDSESAFQIRRYGYTANLPLSILTNFEHFIIYDTRIKPTKDDNSSVARINIYSFKEYVAKFEEIYGLFAFKSILKGSFDKFIQETKSKKGTSEVDKEFLKVIDEWRINLAKNIALRNKDLSIDELNYSIQKIIDRIIFLRISEDRQTEEYKQLFHIVEKEDNYKLIDKLFVKAYKKYNSDIFRPEEFISKLSIDDNALKSIIKGMYYPDCPYEFSVLPIEILGNIYEQFLGKTIRLTPSHQAKIEEKPEVKKAGGVYYTPQYIVDYIVKNTVGEKLNELASKSKAKDKQAKPEDMEKIKILDPACGSGSFLIGAYDYLLRYHLDYYTANKTRIDKAIKDRKLYQISQKEYKLTINEKQNILRNNIYGVDIDRQAVEVTKLSLLLKLMEGEKQEFFGYLFNVDNAFRLLPDLTSNIKCGNSLIGSDILTNQESLMDNDTLKSINPFDWNEEFANVFEKGMSKFYLITFETKYSRKPQIKNKEYKESVLLTNEEMECAAECIIEVSKKDGFKILACSILPDHIHIVIADMGRNIEEIVKNIKGYSAYTVNRRFKSSVQGEGYQQSLWSKSYNSSFLDTEEHLFNAIEYVKNNYEKHKEKWSDININEINSLIKKVITPFSSWKDFEYNNGGFDCVIGNPPYVRVDNLNEKLKNFILQKFNSAKGKYDLYYLFLEKSFSLINKKGYLGFIVPNRFTTSDSGYTIRKFLLENSESIFINSLSNIKVFENASTYPNIIIVNGKCNLLEKLYLKQTKKIEEINAIAFIELNHNEIIKLPNFIFPLNSEKEIINLYIKLRDNCLLAENILLIQEGLRISNNLEKSNGDFHILKQYQFKRYSPVKIGTYVDDKDILKTNRFYNCLKDKLVFAEDALQIEAIYDETKSICQGGVYFGTLIGNCPYNLKYLLAIFNSKLLTILYENLFSGMHMRGGYLRFRTSFLNQLPIPNIDLSNKLDKKVHDTLVSLVDEMLSTQKLLHSSKTEADKKLYQTKANAIDKKIDEIVYKLYGLTDEEIKIVENSF